MFDTSLEYIGSIEMSLNVAGKSIQIKQHNGGTLILHQSICRFLAGQYRGLCDIPNFIDIRNSTSNTSILVQVVSLTGRKFMFEDGEYIVQCEAQIPYSQLTTTISPDDPTTFNVVLCADKDPDIYMGMYRDLAYVQVSAESLSSILPGTSAAIKWKLHIKNGGQLNG